MRMAGESGESCVVGDGGGGPRRLHGYPIYVRDRCWARHEAAVHQKAEPLERLNSNKFFDLSSVPVAMSVDLADVEAISRVRADVDGDRLTLESGFSLWIKTISCKGRIAYQRVRCDLNELGFQVRATRTGLIVGRV